MKATVLNKYVTTRNLNYFLILVGIVFLLAELNRVSDFGIFLEASKDLQEGKNIYQIWYGVGFRYYYSPLFALILTPLTYIPNYLAASLWSFLGMALFIRTIYLLHGYILKTTEPGKLNGLFILSGITVIYANFHNNQMSAFLLWVIIESLEQVRKGHWSAGSIILALGINIKLIPLVLIPYLVYRKRYKAAITTLFLIVGFWLLPAIFIGWDFNIALLKSYWNYINPTLSQNVLDIDEPGLLSLSSLITTWFTDQFSLNELGLRRHFLVLSDKTIGIIIFSVRIVFILISLYFLKWPPFTKPRSHAHQLWEISYLCLVAPLIFPHQQNYGFFLILPALFYILYIFRNKIMHVKLWLRVLFILGLVLINTELIFGAYKKILLNYKVLTYGVLILMFVLTQLDPVKKEMQS